MKKWWCIADLQVNQVDSWTVVIIVLRPCGHCPNIIASERLPLPARIIARLIALALIGGLPACERVEAPPPYPERVQLPADELVVLVRPGPATFYEAPNGQPAGFDADLARLLAARKNLKVRFVPAENAGDLIAAIAQGKAHLGAGGLYRPVTPRRQGLAARFSPARPPADNNGVLWTSGYYNVEPVLIYNADGFKPTRWGDLSGAHIAYLDNTGLDPQLADLRKGHPDVQWTPMDVASGDALVAQVSDGRLDYAIVASNVAALSRNVYLNFEVAFPVDGRRELAWVLPPGAERLRDEIDAWLAQIKRDGTLERLIERHFGHANDVPRLDAGVLQERIHSILPQFRQAFEVAQQGTGIEWRLLAAISYQESQWDPQATSETGVRGMMQLTEETARHLGVIDRLDPKVSIHAAARYLRTLKEKLPARIQEPDRTWLALAAFNIGLGHLEDARILAQKQKLNPDLWSDVKKTLPLLAQPEYYESAKLGYARGGMPVAFVDRVRAYYDVLLAHEPVYRPRLKVTVLGQREADEMSAVVLP